MKRIKELLSFVLMLTILFASTSVFPAYADDTSTEKSAANIQLQVDNPIMTVDGQERAIDENGTTPIIQNGRTILPVRAVVEAMGGGVSWDNASQTATLNYGQHEIKLTIGSTTVYLDGGAQTLDVSPSIINGRTMLPIRFISESFGFQVGWEGSNSTITITREVQQSVENQAHAERRLKITLDGTKVVTATLVESPATEEFLTHLPLTIDMHEHLNRQKEVYLPFSLSEENLQNSVHEYEIGDIVYWHPGPTMGIFHDHDGRSISTGVEVLARLDSDGAEVFASYPDAVEVTFELEAETGSTPNTTANTQGERHLNITLDGKEVITATLVESPATEAFIAQLPITLNMTDYINREKHAPLSFSISEDKLLNIQQEYEIGDIIYYPPGPTFAMYYAHDGNIIRAGFELIARLDQAGIETLSEYADAVEVTVELAK